MSKSRRWLRLTCKAAATGRATTRSIAMTVQELHHVSIVVADLEGAIAFFAELGMELEGQAPIEGDVVDQLNAIDDIRVDIAMMRAPAGDGRLELTKFHAPDAIDGGADGPPNALGLRSLMFTVDDIDATLDGLRAHGSELVGAVVTYEDFYRLCYVRGPEGIIVALSERLG
jgi:catechol 2,3-dioxygenase-like lactoylglutathione lyase family enzyme